jgi:hypothetical protein
MQLRHVWLMHITQRLQANVEDSGGGGQNDLAWCSLSSEHVSQHFTQK